MSIHNASVSVAKHQLISFTRQTLHTAKQQALTFTILPEDQAVLRDPDFAQVSEIQQSPNGLTGFSHMCNSDFAQTVEPGMRTVWVGGGQPGAGASGVALSFEVRGQSTTVDECAAMRGGGKRAAGEWGAGNADAHLWSP